MTPPSKCHGTAIKKNGLVLQQLCGSTSNLLIVQVFWHSELKAYYQTQEKYHWLLIYQIVVLSKLVHIRVKNKFAEQPATALGLVILVLLHWYPDFLRFDSGSQPPWLPYNNEWLHVSFFNK